MALLFPRLGFADSRTSVSVDGESLDYRALASLASAHVAELGRRGISEGDRVGVVAHGSLPTIAALVGNACARVVTIPINPKLGANELAHVMRDAAPRAVFADGIETPESIATVPIELGSTRELPNRLVDDAPLFILYTSGTTGAPKGAILTARNVAANIDGLAAAWDWSDSDTVAHALPLFHVHGLVLGLFGSLRVGGALAHRSRFDPVSLADELTRSTMLFAVPTMYHRLLEAAETDPRIREALRSARLLVSGSAPLPAREHRQVEALTGRGVHERYGLTESLIDCAIPARHPPRPGYVGPPVPGVEVRLVDDARRTIDAVDDATIGEVAVRGPSVFAGYLNRDDATRAVVDAEGWFYTGDLATRTSDGYVRIVGRRSTDLIKTGGYKVGAGEIETCLLENDSVSECAVIGVPDDDLGERIVAYVVPKPGRSIEAESLVDHVARTLAPHKRPREIVVRESLPRNAMGKVQKTRLRP